VVKRLRVLTVVTLALLGGGAAHAEEVDSPKRWEAFALDELGEQREATSRPWLEFLKVPSLSTGLYVLPGEGRIVSRPTGATRSTTSSPAAPSSRSTASASRSDPAPSCT